jgi:hypothetical protein
MRLTSDAGVDEADMTDATDGRTDARMGRVCDAQWRDVDAHDDAHGWGLRWGCDRIETKNAHTHTHTHTMLTHPSFGVVACARARRARRGVAWCGSNARKTKDMRRLKVITCATCIQRRNGVLCVYYARAGARRMRGATVRYAVFALGVLFGPKRLPNMSMHTMAMCPQ